MSRKTAARVGATGGRTTDHTTTTPEETMTSRPPDSITLNRDQLAALLAHHADILAARWDAVAPGAGAWEVAAAHSIRGHAAELTSGQERPAIRELLDSILTEAEQPAAPSTPADLDVRRALYEADSSSWYEVINPRNATTSIALVHDDGSLYLPEGPDALTVEEFHFAAARGRTYRMMRVDEAMAVADAEQADLHTRLAQVEELVSIAHQTSNQSEAARAAAAARVAEVRRIAKRLVAHAKGFQDVLDESDRDPWARLVRVDIDELRTATAVLPAPTDRAAGLTDREKAMLGFALEMAQEEIHARSLELTDDDRDALASLRRMADEAQQTEHTPEPQP
ncbi:hypothetical protein [Streptomyces sp. LNU-CPARS28]|uniref:hypothetical protein n=1 Tax=Streptomyces sp. LNU-CPARS28 TaxID=3137371 RepID=UPI0031357866